MYSLKQKQKLHGVKTRVESMEAKTEN